MTVRKLNDATVLQRIKANTVLTKLYKPQLRDAKTDLPVVKDDQYQQAWRFMNITEMVAAVNFVSLQDISGKITDTDKYVVVVQKQMA